MIPTDDPPPTPPPPPPPPNTPPPAPGKGKGKAKHRVDGWQDQINNIPYRDLRYNQANIPPAGVGSMLNASMRSDKPKPPPPSVDSDDEAAYSGPPLSSTRIKLPMFFDRAGSDLDNDGDEMDTEDGVDADNEVRSVRHDVQLALTTLRSNSLPGLKFGRCTTASGMI